MKWLSNLKIFFGGARLSLVLPHESLASSTGLREACRILFGEAAEEKWMEYFQTPFYHEPSEPKKASIVHSTDQNRHPDTAVTQKRFTFRWASGTRSTQSRIRRASMSAPSKELALYFQVGSTSGECRHLSGCCFILGGRHRSTRLFPWILQFGQL